MLFALIGFSLSTSILDNLASLHKANISVDFGKLHLNNVGSLVLPQMKLSTNFIFRNIHLYRNINPFIISFSSQNKIDVANSLFSHFLSPAIMLDTTDVSINGQTFTQNNRDSVLMISLKPAFYGASSTITITNCVFQNINVDQAVSGLKNQEGAGLSIRLGSGSSSALACNISISSCTFTNCTAAFSGNRGGAMFIECIYNPMTVSLHNINISRCSAISGAAYYIIDQQAGRSTVEFDQVNIMDCSSTPISNGQIQLQTKTCALENVGIFMRYSSFTGNSTNIYQDMVHFTNCTGIVSNMQFSNINITENQAIIRVGSSNINFTHICITKAIESKSIYGLIATGNSVVFLTEFYYTNNIAGTQAVIHPGSPFVTTPIACNIITASNTFTQSNPFSASSIFTASAPFTLSSPFTQSSVFQQTPLDDSSTQFTEIDINETDPLPTSTIDDSSIKRNSDAGMIAGVSVAALVVLILIIVIVLILCKKLRCICMCCEKKAFNLSIDEESSHQELYFPNFEPKSL
ncbi:hypothetical protein TRFO_32199 [Tritrichomonas foetus]|uniref:Right handed beta helix domain-containing protein n=1 Tax=Tritrichomonas foetus TaxID=1144522 RepID=A0A1J4JR98_9EUKA|nr:hypothetical protein TRFO_32199 [Tritrichomonas foetus]|eukprot:OHT00944.1 hypothetical protein TRFO_32199 [Tritrichomonas foetus]